MPWGKVWRNIHLTGIHIIMEFGQLWTFVRRAKWLISLFLSNWKILSMNINLSEWANSMNVHMFLMGNRVKWDEDMHYPTGAFSASNHSPTRTISLIGKLPTLCKYIFKKLCLPIIHLTADGTVGKAEPLMGWKRNMVWTDLLNKYGLWGSCICIHKTAFVIRIGLHYIKLNMLTQSSRRHLFTMCLLPRYWPFLPRSWYLSDKGFQKTIRKPSHLLNI